MKLSIFVSMLTCVYTVQKNSEFGKNIFFHRFLFRKSWTMYRRAFKRSWIMLYRCQCISQFWKYGFHDVWSVDGKKLQVWKLFNTRRKLLVRKFSNQKDKKGKYNKNFNRFLFRPSDFLLAAKIIWKLLTFIKKNFKYIRTEYSKILKNVSWHNIICVKRKWSHIWPIWLWCFLARTIRAMR